MKNGTVNMIISLDNLEMNKDLLYYVIIFSESGCQKQKKKKKRQ